MVEPQVVHALVTVKDENGNTILTYHTNPNRDSECEIPSHAEDRTWVNEVLNLAIDAVHAHAKKKSHK